MITPNSFSLLFLMLLVSAQLTYGQHTILWKVTDTTTHKTSVLLGTYHLFGNSFIDSIPEIKAYLYASEIAIFEALDDKGKTTETINKRKDTNIRTALGKKTYSELSQLTQAWAVDLHKLSPAELRWKLDQEYARLSCNTVKQTDKWDHMDNYLEFLATEKGIAVYGFETYAEQVELINQEYQSPDWKQEKKTIKYLMKLLSGSKAEKDNCAFTHQYRNFELAYQFESECPLEVLLIERNAKWMKEIPGMIRERNCFIAVGLLHLYYNCGLLEQLRTEGFIIEPITLTPHD